MNWAKMRVIVLAGDVVLLVAFAAIGHSNHGETEAPSAVLMTALPFLVGWFLAAAMLGTYRSSSYRSARVGARTGLLTAVTGVMIALAVRSILEHHIVPTAFAAVALIFNAVLLTIWHMLAAALSRRWI